VSRATKLSLSPARTAGGIRSCVSGAKPAPRLLAEFDADAPTWPITTRMPCARLLRGAPRPARPCEPDLPRRSATCSRQLPS
jgi:hypothetical protein